MASSSTIGPEPHKESQAQLTARLSRAATQVQVGARYRHYKGNLYTVLMLALREVDNEPCVIYRAEYGDQTVFIRPVVNWLETVITDDQPAPRFAMVK